MSGIEAAGLVLGAWPLVVNLVTLYNSGKNGQEWELILHEVKTEELIYVECIESLLQADVPESVLLQLSSRQKPNHLLWKDPGLQRNLENRLGTKRFPVVLQTLQNMDILLNVLNEKLKGLEIPSVSYPTVTQSKLSLLISNKETSHLKLRSGLRNIRVNLPHASIKDNIRKLHKCNKLLQRIITPRTSSATVAEAPDSQPEILTKLPPDILRRITEDANALHRAIGDGYSCSCPGGHETHLGLHPLTDHDIAQPYELLFPVDEETVMEITGDVVASPVSSTSPDNIGSDADRRMWVSYQGLLSILHIVLTIIVHSRQDAGLTVGAWKLLDPPCSAKERSQHQSVAVQCPSAKHKAPRAANSSKIFVSSSESLEKSLQLKHQHRVLGYWA